MDIEMLLKIAQLGGVGHSVEVSSSKIARDLDSSQQTAARRLKSLEKEGLITREVKPKGQTIRITSRGKEVLGGLYMELSDVFGKPEGSVMICGTITTGMGEGEYYMKLEEYKTQFKEKLGFTPFQGTLNLKLKGADDIRIRQRLDDLPAALIKGFKKEGRSFGSVKCFKADIEGIDGAVIIPARTHHSSDTIEVIAEVKIKDELGVGEGDRICVKMKV